ncbi:hypothetical protein CkaCkLH20_03228 [Colletotrichum karsti]|uniref:Involucrin repeat protein n=1 Tax=Colletotrichum karsti TaxID=1095194 RepID=A0A9P6IHD6_9PEZI|nr:uncharacterized protein CkaCkLH20_03228 [Colletotrichum karsti]KAF9878995.1 hypothetical protein CkaCkLH20_03228 [Colletotrichum karsti]
MPVPGPSSQPQSYPLPQSLPQNYPRSQYSQPYAAPQRYPESENYPPRPQRYDEPQKYGDPQRYPQPEPYVQNERYPESQAYHERELDAESQALSYGDSERRRPRGGSSSSASSSTSSSFLNISAKSPRFGGVFSTFWKTPSEQQKRRRKKKQKARILSLGNSSSSSVNSDLAYGRGYIERDKSQLTTPIPSVYASPAMPMHREPVQARQEPPPAPRSKTDEEILEIGRQLQDIARRQNDADSRAASKSRTSQLAGAAGIAGAAAAFSHFRKNKASSKSRGAGSSKLKDRGSSSDDDWESASDDESSTDSSGSSDAGLVYGAEIKPSKSARISSEPPEQIKPPARKNTVVDPRLFGPYNSLRGAVKSPCGFGEEDPRSTGSFRRHHEETVAQVQSPKTGKQPMQHVYPVPTSDPNKFDFDRSSVTSSRQELPQQSRPAPVPLQQPIPIVPVSSKVYDADRFVEDEPRSSRRQPPKGRSAAENAIAGVGVTAAAIGAAMAVRRDSAEYLERRDDRRSEFRERRDEPHEIRENRRTEERTERPARIEVEDRESRDQRDPRRSTRRNDVQIIDDRDKRQAVRDDLTRKPTEKRPIGTDPRPEVYRLPRGDEIRVEYDPDEDRRRREVPKEAREEQRKPEGFAEHRDAQRAEKPSELPRDYHGVEQPEVPVTQAPIDPFQFQVADDAFQTPKYATPKNATPKRPLTPQVVTVDREPNFDDSPPRKPDYSDARMSRKDSFELEQRLEQYQQQGFRDRSRNPEPRRRRDSLEEEEHAAKSIYDEAKHATAPLAAAAFASAIAVEEERSRKRRSDHVTEDGSRDRSQATKDAVQEEADRYYRETVLARKIAEDEIRSRSSSPHDKSVVGKWQDREGPEAVTIVTPPEMDHPHDKSPYDGPNADVRIDHIIIPDELHRFRLPHGQLATGSAPVFRSRDPSCDRERPLLNLVLPTPLVTPRATPAPEQQKETKQTAKTRETTKSRSKEKKEAPADPAPEIVLGPKGEVMERPTTPTAKSVTWGENQTKSFEAESPEPPKAAPSTTSTKTKSKKRFGKSSPWGIIAAAVGGAGAAAAASSATAPEIRDPFEEKKPDDDKATHSPPQSPKSRAVEPAREPVAAPPSPKLVTSFDEEQDLPPAPGPKPSSPQTSQMPGSFADDIEFASVLAAGLQDTGFDPNIVIDNPAYMRRDSPPGQSEPSVYQQPFAETVTDLGVYGPDYVHNSSSTRGPGFVVGEVPETSASEKDLKVGNDTNGSSSQEKHDKGKTKENALSDEERATNDSEPVKKLSKKEKRKQKAAKRQSADDAPAEVFQDATSAPETTPQHEWHGNDKDVRQSPETVVAPGPKSRGLEDAPAWDLSSSSHQSRSFEEPLSSRMAGSYDERAYPSNRPFDEPDSFATTRSFDESAFFQPSQSFNEPSSFRSDEATSHGPTYSDVPVADYDTASPTKSSKKEKKKSRSSRSDVILVQEEDGRPAEEFVIKESRTSREKSPELDEYTPAERRETGDDPADTPKKKKKSKKSKQSSDEWTDVERQVDDASGVGKSEKGTPTRVTDDWDDRPTKSRRDRSRFEDNDVSSVVSDPSSRREKSDRRFNGSRYEDDDAKSVASDGTSRKRRNRDEKKSPKDDEKRSSGSFFGLFRPASGSSKDTSGKDEKSFLDNAGTLGAGAGLASAVAALGSMMSRSNATEPHAEESPIDLRPLERSVSPPQDVDILDPEITQRVIRPAIDPQYGDLLPLPPSPMPPSTLGSPTQELDELPALPDSRPETPPDERRRQHEMKTHVRRRSNLETPSKSPSQTAVPFKLRLGQRSTPSSPGNLGQAVSPISPPMLPTFPEPPLSRRPSARPISWERGSEFKPLYLLEHARQEHAAQLMEPPIDFPELPPSEPSSRESPAPEFAIREDDTNYSQLLQPSPFEPDELRIDTGVPQFPSSFGYYGSQEATPTKEQTLQYTGAIFGPESPALPATPDLARQLDFSEHEQVELPALPDSPASVVTERDASLDIQPATPTLQHDSMELPASPTSSPTEAESVEVPVGPILMPESPALPSDPDAARQLDLSEHELVDLPALPSSPVMDQQILRTPPSGLTADRNLTESPVFSIESEAPASSTATKYAPESPALPATPDIVRHIDLSEHQLEELPALPVSPAFDNELSSPFTAVKFAPESPALPSTPDAARHINLSEHQLEKLPTLPASPVMENEPLASFPTIKFAPESPALPTTPGITRRFDLSERQLDELPALPASPVIEPEVFYTGVRYLPESPVLPLVPDAAKQLDIAGRELDELPALPGSPVSEPEADSTGIKYLPESPILPRLRTAGQLDIDARGLHELSDLPALPASPAMSPVAATEPEPEPVEAMSKDRNTPPSPTPFRTQDSAETMPAIEEEASSRARDIALGAVAGGAAAGLATAALAREGSADDKPTDTETAAHNFEAAEPAEPLVETKLSEKAKKKRKNKERRMDDITIPSVETTYSSEPLDHGADLSTTETVPPSSTSNDLPLRDFVPAIQTADPTIHLPEASTSASVDNSTTPPLPTEVPLPSTSEEEVSRSPALPSAPGVAAPTEVTSPTATGEDRVMSPVSRGRFGGFFSRFRPAHMLLLQRSGYNSSNPPSPGAWSEDEVFEDEQPPAVIRAGKTWPTETPLAESPLSRAVVSKVHSPEFPTPQPDHHGSLPPTDLALNTPADPPTLTSDDVPRSSSPTDNTVLSAEPAQSEVLLPAAGNDDKTPSTDIVGKDEEPHHAESSKPLAATITENAALESGDVPLEKKLSKKDKKKLKKAQAKAIELERSPDSIENTSYSPSLEKEATAAAQIDAEANVPLPNLEAQLPLADVDATTASVEAPATNPPHETEAAASLLEAEAQVPLPDTNAQTPRPRDDKTALPADSQTVPISQDTEAAMQTLETELQAPFPATEELATSPGHQQDQHVTVAGPSAPAPFSEPSVPETKKSKKKNKKAKKALEMEDKQTPTIETDNMHTLASVPVALITGEEDKSTDLDKATPSQATEGQVPSPSQDDEEQQTPVPVSKDQPVETKEQQPQLLGAEENAASVDDISSEVQPPVVELDDKPAYSGDSMMEQQAQFQDIEEKVTKVDGPQFESQPPVSEPDEKPLPVENILLPDPETSILTQAGSSAPVDDAVLEQKPDPSFPEEKPTRSDEHSPETQAPAAGKETIPANLDDTLIAQQTPLPDVDDFLQEQETTIAKSDDNLIAQQIPLPDIDESLGEPLPEALNVEPLAEPSSPTLSKKQKKKKKGKKNQAADEGSLTPGQSTPLEADTVLRQEPQIPDTETKLADDSELSAEPRDLEVKSTDVSSELARDGTSSTTDINDSSKPEVLVLSPTEKSTDETSSAIAERPETFSSSTNEGSKDLHESATLSTEPYAQPSQPESPSKKKKKKKSKAASLSQPDNSISGETAPVQHPKFDTPVVETPTPRTPIDETPAVETPVVSNPVVETPVVETPTGEKTATETPAFETPLEAPVVNEPVVETPVVETPTGEKNTAESPALETSLEAPVVNNPVVETPTGEKTVTETPAFETPLEAPIVTNPVVETPVVETPTGEKTIVETPAFEAAGIKIASVQDPELEISKPSHASSSPSGTPVIESQVVETPVVETPTSAILDENSSSPAAAETPVIENQVVETPIVETPANAIVDETLVIESQVVETPLVETPASAIVDETPVIEDQVVETPLVETPTGQTTAETPGQTDEALVSKLPVEKTEATVETQIDDTPVSKSISAESPSFKAPVPQESPTIDEAFAEPEAEQPAPAIPQDISLQDKDQHQHQGTQDVIATTDTLEAPQSLPADSVDQADNPTEESSKTSKKSKKKKKKEKSMSIAEPEPPTSVSDDLPLDVADITNAAEQATLPGEKTVVEEVRVPDVDVGDSPLQPKNTDLEESQESRASESAYAESQEPTVIESEDDAFVTPRQGPVVLEDDADLSGSLSREPTLLESQSEAIDAMSQEASAKKDESGDVQAQAEPESPVESKKSKKKKKKAAAAAAAAAAALEAAFENAPQNQNDNKEEAKDETITDKDTSITPDKTGDTEPPPQDAPTSGEFAPDIKISEEADPGTAVTKKGKKKKKGKKSSTLDPEPENSPSTRVPENTADVANTMDKSAYISSPTGEPASDEIFFPQADTRTEAEWSTAANTGKKRKSVTWAPEVASFSNGPESPQDADNGPECQSGNVPASDQLPTTGPSQPRDQQNAESQEGKAQGSEISDLDQAPAHVAAEKDLDPESQAQTDPASEGNVASPQHQKHDIVPSDYFPSSAGLNKTRGTANDSNSTDQGYFPSAHRMLPVTPSLSLVGAGAANRKGGETSERKLDAEEVARIDADATNTEHAGRSGAIDEPRAGTTTQTGEVGLSDPSLHAVVESTSEQGYDKSLQDTQNGRITGAQAGGPALTDSALEAGGPQHTPVPHLADQDTNPEIPQPLVRELPSLLQVDKKSDAGITDAVAETRPEDKKLYDNPDTETSHDKKKDEEEQSGPFAADAERPGRTDTSEPLGEPLTSEPELDSSSKTLPEAHPTGVVNTTHSSQRTEAEAQQEDDVWSESISSTNMSKKDKKNKKTKAAGAEPTPQDDVHEIKAQNVDDPPAVQLGAESQEESTPRAPDVAPVTEAVEAGEDEWAFQPVGKKSKKDKKRRAAAQAKEEATRLAAQTPETVVADQGPQPQPLEADEMLRTDIAEEVQSSTAPEPEESFVDPSGSKKSKKSKRRQSLAESVPDDVSSSIGPTPDAPSEQLELPEDIDTSDFETPTKKSKRDKKKEKQVGEESRDYYRQVGPVRPHFRGPWAAPAALLAGNYLSVNKERKFSDVAEEELRSPSIISGVDDVTFTSEHPEDAPPPASDPQPITTHPDIIQKDEPTSPPGSVETGPPAQLTETQVTDEPQTTREITSDVPTESEIMIETPNDSTTVQPEDEFPAVTKKSKKDKKKKKKGPSVDVLDEQQLPLQTGEALEPSKPEETSGQPTQPETGDVGQQIEEIAEDTTANTRQVEQKPAVEQPGVSEPVEEQPLEETAEAELIESKPADDEDLADVAKKSKKDKKKKKKAAAAVQETYLEQSMETDANPSMGSLPQQPQEPKDLSTDEQLPKTSLPSEHMTPTDSHLPPTTVDTPEIILPTESQHTDVLQQQPTVDPDEEFPVPEKKSKKDKKKKGKKAQEDPFIDTIREPQAETTSRSEEVISREPETTSAIVEPPAPSFETVTPKDELASEEQLRETEPVQDSMDVEQSPTVDPEEEFPLTGKNAKKDKKKKQASVSAVTEPQLEHQIDTGSPPGIEQSSAAVPVPEETFPVVPVEEQEANSATNDLPVDVQASSTENRPSTFLPQQDDRDEEFPLTGKKEKKAKKKGKVVDLTEPEVLSDPAAEPAKGHNEPSVETPSETIQTENISEQPSTSDAPLAMDSSTQLEPVKGPVQEAAKDQDTSPTDAQVLREELLVERQQPPTDIASQTPLPLVDEPSMTKLSKKDKKKAKKGKAQGDSDMLSGAATRLEETQTTPMPESTDVLQDTSQSGLLAPEAPLVGEQPNDMLLSPVQVDVPALHDNDNREIAVETDTARSPQHQGADVPEVASPPQPITTEAELKVDEPFTAEEPEEFVVRNSKKDKKKNKAAANEFESESTTLYSDQPSATLEKPATITADSSMTPLPLVEAAAADPLDEWAQATISKKSKKNKKKKNQSSGVEPEISRDTPLAEPEVASEPQITSPLEADNLRASPVQDVKLDAQPTSAPHEPLAELEAVYEPQVNPPSPVAELPSPMQNVELDVQETPALKETPVFSAPPAEIPVSDSTAQTISEQESSTPPPITDTVTGSGSPSDEPPVSENERKIRDVAKESQELPPADRDAAEPIGEGPDVAPIEKASKENKKRPSLALEDFEAGPAIEFVDAKDTGERDAPQPIQLQADEAMPNPEDNIANASNAPVDSPPTIATSQSSEPAEQEITTEAATSREAILDPVLPIPEAAERTLEGSAEKDNIPTVAEELGENLTPKKSKKDNKKKSASQAQREGEVTLTPDLATPSASISSDLLRETVPKEENGDTNRGIVDPPASPNANELPHPATSIEEPDQAKEDAPGVIVIGDKDISRPPSRPASPQRDFNSTEKIDVPGESHSSQDAGFDSSNAPIDKTATELPIANDEWDIPVTKKFKKGKKQSVPIDLSSPANVDPTPAIDSQPDQLRDDAGNPEYFDKATLEDTRSASTPPPPEPANTLPTPTDVPEQADITVPSPESIKSTPVDLQPAQESSSLVHDVPFDQSEKRKKLKTREQSNTLLPEPILSSREIAAAYLDDHSNEEPTDQTATIPDEPFLPITAPGTPQDQERPEPRFEEDTPKHPLPQEPSAIDMAASYLERKTDHESAETVRSPSPIEQQRATDSSAIGAAIAAAAIGAGAAIASKSNSQKDDVVDDPSLWEGANKKHTSEIASAEAEKFWGVGDVEDAPRASAGTNEMEDGGLDFVAPQEQLKSERHTSTEDDDVFAPTSKQRDSSLTQDGRTGADRSPMSSVKGVPDEQLSYISPPPIGESSRASGSRSPAEHKGSEPSRGKTKEIPSFTAPLKEEAQDDNVESPILGREMDTESKTPTERNMDRSLSSSFEPPTTSTLASDLDEAVDHGYEVESRRELSSGRALESPFRSPAPSILPPVQEEAQEENEAQSRILPKVRSSRALRTPEPQRDGGVRRDWQETTSQGRDYQRTPEVSSHRERRRSRELERVKSPSVKEALRRSPFAEEETRDFPLSRTPVLREPSGRELTPTPEPHKMRRISPELERRRSKYQDLASAALAGAAISSTSSPRSTPPPGNRSVSERVARLQSPAPVEPPVARRSISNSSLSRHRRAMGSATPEPLKFRPESPGISRPATATPPLRRRTDRRMSGDLRSLSQRSHQDLTQDPTPTSSSNTPVANEGRVRTKDMADVYDGFGEGRIGSPRSPTRPHSMRRRQSMQVLELESRVEQLMAENRMLTDARTHTDTHNGNRASGILAERDAEIDVLKQSLEFLQKEVARLTEVNEGLNSANAQLAAQHNERYRSLETQHADASRQLEEARNEHTHFQESLSQKDAEIGRLRSELDAAKDKIRQMQRQILAAKGADSDFLNVKDVDHFDHRCQQLCSHVQQWVLRFSKFSDMRACRLTSEINDEKVIDRLDNAILDGTDVDAYLADRVRRRDVFMSMTMNMIWEFVFTRYLFGMDREQRQKLKSLEKLLTEVGPAQAVRQWRAVTLTLLSKRPSFKHQRDLDTEAVVQAIFQTLSKVLPPPSNLEDQIQSQLRRVMREAVDLSVEMRTQRAEYMMLPPLQPEYDADGELAETVTFNAALMNERSGDKSVTNEALEAQNATVRIVLFPLVVKKGDDAGNNDDEIVVCPAQVLVARSKGKSVRLFTPGSDVGGASVVGGNSAATHSELSMGTFLPEQASNRG